LHKLTDEKIITYTSCHPADRKGRSVTSPWNNPSGHIFTISIIVVPDSYKGNDKRITKNNKIGTGKDKLIAKDNREVS
jgi:hypothetical protein